MKIIVELHKFIYITEL